MIRIASTVVFIALAGCSPQPEPGDSIPMAPLGEVQTIHGMVRIVGSAPVNVQIVLQPESGGAVRLTGPLRGELERLAGVEVSVMGRLSPSPDPLVDQEMEATAYEIRSVNGRGVVVGEVVQVTPEEATLRTADGAEIYLRGVPAEFQPGQKVWVQGPETLVVQSYGVLRP